MKDSITSYTFNFIHDIHMDGKYKKVTDNIDEKGGGNIIDMIRFIVHPLVENMKQFSEKKKYFVIAMDIYFTFPKRQ